MTIVHIKLSNDETIYFNCITIHYFYEQLLEKQLTL